MGGADMGNGPKSSEGILSIKTERKGWVVTWASNARLGSVDWVLECEMAG